MSNGCGCETGLLKYIKPPYAKIFYAACCIHDDNYDVGGSKADRAKADAALFRNMLIIITKSNYNVWKSYHLATIALVYYISVRIFGKQYFNYK